MAVNCSDAGRAAADVGSTTGRATTALGRSALTVTPDAFTGGTDTDSTDCAVTDFGVESVEAALALSLDDAADCAVTDFRVDAAEAVLTLSLDDAVVDGFTFFAGLVDDECPEPDGFLPDVLVDTAALVTSVSLAGSDAAADGVVSVASAVDPDGVVSVVPALDPDGLVSVVPALDPDGVDVVPGVVDASEAGVAHATPVEDESEIADPMPRATANAPSRPM